MPNQNGIRVQLGQALRRTDRTIRIERDSEYTEVTVRLHGRGVVARRRVLGEEIAAEQRYVVESGQFILSRIDARNGALGVVPNELHEAVVSNDFPCYDVNPEVVDVEFLGLLSRTPRFVDLCRRASEGTTNRVRLDEAKFLSFVLVLPSVREQRVLAEKAKQLLLDLEQARFLHVQAAAEVGAVFRSALAAAMDPHGEAWTRATVGDVIFSLDAGWSPQCEDDPVSPSGWGVLKTTSVQWCRFDPSENKALPPHLTPRPELAVVEGDVLVTRAGPLKRVGVVATARASQPTLMISDKIMRVRVDQSRVDPLFLELSLTAPFSQEHLVRRKTGLADAQVNISQAILRATPLAYPSLNEQRAIIARLESIRELVDEAELLHERVGGELEALEPSILGETLPVRFE